MSGNVTVQVARRCTGTVCGRRTLAAGGAAGLAARAPPEAACSGGASPSGWSVGGYGTAALGATACGALDPREVDPAVPAMCWPKFATGPMEMPAMSPPPVDRCVTSLCGSL